MSITQLEGYLPPMPVGHMSQQDYETYVAHRRALHDEVVAEKPWLKQRHLDSRCPWCQEVQA